MTSEFKIQTSDLRKFPVSCNRDSGGGCALTNLVDASSKTLLKVSISLFISKYMTGFL